MHCRTLPPRPLGSDTCLLGDGSGNVGDVGAARSDSPVDLKPAWLLALLGQPGSVWGK